MLNNIIKDKKIITILFSFSILVILNLFNEEIKEVLFKNNHQKIEEVRKINKNMIKIIKEYEKMYSKEDKKKINSVFLQNLKEKKSLKRKKKKNVIINKDIEKEEMIKDFTKTIKSIIINDKIKKVGLSDNNYYKVGEIVDGYKIIEIKEDGIKVKTKGKIKWVNF